MVLAAIHDLTKVLEALFSIARLDLDDAEERAGVVMARVEL